MIFQYAFTKEASEYSIIEGLPHIQQASTFAVYPACVMPEVLQKQKQDYQPISIKG